MVATRVVQFARFGGPEVLELAHRTLPTPRDSEVLVRIRAAGANPVDYRIRQGKKLSDIELPYVGGRELAGTVVEVGPSVRSLAPGDEVFGSVPDGAFADFTVIDGRYLAKRPEAVPVVVAAGLALAGQTAWDALAAMQLSPSDSLFVSGATGGVGSILVQLARNRGITVYGSASVRNHPWLRGIGVIPVDYGQPMTEQLHQVAPQGFSGAIDLAGETAVSALIEAGVDPRRINSLAIAPEHFGTLRRGRGDTSLPTLNTLAALVADGSLTIPIEATFPLEQAADAFVLLETRHVRGKVVLET